jgi:capsular exopolysaccharide synthesis family protein
VSKYFDETQRAEDWLVREGAAKRQDISTVIENIRKPEPVVAEIQEPEAPLVGCRKIHLSSITDTSIVVGGKDSRHHATEAYRALRTRLMRLQSSKGIRSVAVSSAAPGDGKTVTTLNLGLCYAQLHDTPVLLIDCDLRSRRLSQIFGNPPAPGLAEVLTGEASYEEAVVATNNPNLYVLSAGSMMVSAPELLSGNAWKELIAWCNERFRLILIDTPPVRPLADFELISAGCDAFLMVVRAHQTQREALQQLAGQIDAKKLAGVVLNSAETYSKSGYSNSYAYQG